MFSPRGSNPNYQEATAINENFVFVQNIAHLTLRNKCLYSGKISSIGGINHGSIFASAGIPAVSFFNLQSKRNKSNAS